MAQFELEWIQWLSEETRRRSNRRRDGAIQLGVGDDMALIATPGSRVLLATDMLLDGVHVDTKCHDEALIGRKALACCLSDCAAMAVKPVAAAASVAFPTDWGLERARRLMSGLLHLADQFLLSLIGGDTTRWDHPLAIDVAILAVPYEGIEPVTRARARPGDRLYVTGTLGGSGLGRHLTFTPRIEEARRLASDLGAGLHAMMDISDGLSLDLWRLGNASGVGAMLDERLLSAAISPDAHRLSRCDGSSPLDHALGDGEDFELLLAVDAGISPEHSFLIPVGEIVESGFSLRHEDGRIEPLAPRGYVH